MTYRVSCLFVLVALTLSACAQIDDPVATQQTVSAVVLEEDSGQQFVVELSYDSAQVTYEEAVVLVNNIDVLHDSGLSLAEVDERVLANATGILYEEPNFSDLSNHEFQVEVYSETIDLQQQIDDFRWEWVTTDIVEFSQHCPPGHGGRF